MTRLDPALTGLGIVVIPAAGQPSGGSRNWSLHDPDGISLTYMSAGASEASIASTTPGWAPADTDSF